MILPLSPAETALQPVGEPSGGKLPPLIARNLPETLPALRGEKRLLGFGKAKLSEGH